MVEVIRDFGFAVDVNKKASGRLKDLTDLEYLP